MNIKDTYIAMKSNYLLKNFRDALEPYTPLLSDSMKKVGIFTRFYGHHVSCPLNIFEISGDTYNTVSSNPFHVVVKLDWTIRGPKYTTIQSIRGQNMEVIGVEDTNKQAVKDMLLTMPGLSSYISDYLQYWQGE